MNIIKFRKHIRLKNFDYSKSGYYYVTICTKNRSYIFGNVFNGKMVLNDIGKIVNDIWLTISKHFNNVKLDQFQIMPNHIHGIIVIVGRENRAPTLKHDTSKYTTLKYTPTLGQIIAYFKYESTKRINNIVGKRINNIVGVGFSYPNKIKKIFQRNYYEHIIRNEIELLKIRQYIKNNPFF